MTKTTLHLTTFAATLLLAACGGGKDEATNTTPPAGSLLEAAKEKGTETAKQNALPKPDANKPLSSYPELTSGQQVMFMYAAASKLPVSTICCRAVSCSMGMERIAADNAGAASEPPAWGLSRSLLSTCCAFIVASFPLIWCSFARRPWFFLGSSQSGSRKRLGHRPRCVNEAQRAAICYASIRDKQTEFIALLASVCTRLHPSAHVCTRLRGM